MRNKMDNKGFTLTEALVVLSVVMILMTILVGAGKHLKTRAEKELTAGGIAAIVTALEQYYDAHTAFPPQIDSDVMLKAVLNANAVTITNGAHPNPADADLAKAEKGKDFWRSESLFYFLDRTPASRKIIEALASRMSTNKDETGVNLVLTVDIPVIGIKTVDWVRFVDAWGASLRYTYQAGDTFPLIESAGPDKDFNTTGDNLSSQ